MSDAIEIGGRAVGAREPCFIIGEIGINHNGDVDLALQLVDVAAEAGCDAVKLQKRTPQLCVPPEEHNRPKETPWGEMTYLEYRERLELGESDYRRIDERCRERGMRWFASCWDEDAVDFIDAFDPVCFKIASASLTDHGLIRRLIEAGKPLLVSTGMSTMEEIERAVEVIDDAVPWALMHCTSAYPSAPEEINLKMIDSLHDRFRVPVGYSGHEVGLQVSLAAIARGASMLERHITLDRTMWGSDQAASVEPGGLQRLVRDVRVIEAAMGDGVKRVYDSELPLRRRLRRV